MPEWKVYVQIKGRCFRTTNKNYSEYGGRGIGMCEEWKNDFANFLMDMGKRPSPEYSIDRINNDGNYEPSNCRWATKIDQANNKRNNVLYTIGEKTQSLAIWCREYSIERKTVLTRLKYNWGIEKALTYPIRKQKNNKSIY